MNRHSNVSKRETHTGRGGERGWGERGREGGRERR